MLSRVIVYSVNGRALCLLLSKEASGIRNSVVVFKRCNTGLDNDTYLEIIREQSPQRRRFCVETVEVYVWTGKAWLQRFSLMTE